MAAQRMPRPTKKRSRKIKTPTLAWVEGGESLEKAFVQFMSEERLGLDGEDGRN
jgi:hypothetical protein